MTPSWSSRRHATNISAAFLTLLILVAACSTTTAPTATPMPSDAPPSVAPSESPSESPSGGPVPTPAPTPRTDLEWVAVDVPEAPVHSAILEVVGGNDGLVAIGFDGSFGSIVWRLTDLEGWRDATPSGFAGLGLAAAATHDGRIVAVGRGDTINVDADVAAVLLSEDGGTWRQASTDMRGQLIDVIATDDGLVAIGGVPGDDSAGAWRSTDGDTWERLGADLEHAFLWSVTEGGPGLVAVGWRRNPDPQLAVWTSADGDSWELSPDVEGSIGFEATHVVTAPDGTLVMTGSAFDGNGGRIWTSTDGLAWTEAAIEMDGGYARRLAVTPWGLVAVGGRAMAGTAWISVDGGRSWTGLGDPIPNAFLSEAFATDGGTLIVTGATQEGTMETGITGAAAIWTMTLE